jgi:hypothetical protein
VRLWLSLLDDNLGNQWRRLALLREIGNLVADELAAAADEDGRPSDYARSLSTGCCWPRVI